MWITQLADRRRLRRLGEGRRRRDPRLRPREGHEGPLRAQDRRQDVAARLDHRRDRHGRRARPGGEPAARASKGLAGPFGCLNKARYGIAWGAIGAAEVCWHARAPVRRSTASSSAGRSPRTSSSSSSSPTCMTEITHRAAVLPAGRPADGRGHGRRRRWCRSSSATRAASRSRSRALARDMHGGNGIADEFHVIRHVSTSRRSTPTRGRTTSMR